MAKPAVKLPAVVPARTVRSRKVIPAPVAKPELFRTPTLPSGPATIVLSAAKPPPASASTDAKMQAMQNALNGRINGLQTALSAILAKLGVLTAKPAVAANIQQQAGVPATTATAVSAGPLVLIAAMVGVAGTTALAVRRMRRRRESRRVVGEAHQHLVRDEGLDGRYKTFA